MAAADDRSQPQGAPLRVAIDHAVADVPTAPPDAVAGDVLRGLAGRTLAAVDDVVVLRDGVAVGLAPLETLLEAPGDRPVGELMRPDPPTVGLDTDQGRAAHALVASGARCLVVAREDGRFEGVIPAERLLAVLLAEHDRDLARLGGYLAGATRARGAVEEPLGRRLWHRLPWLLVGLLGAMGSALLIGAFDSALETNVIVAFFVPAIVYMADAVGTQTETLLIRALTAGASVRAIVARELMTGVIVGLVVGAAFFAFAAAGWGDTAVAGAVALALVASCSIATLVAMGLPSLFERLGRDPAFGSGPLATVIQDLLSIAVYFAIVLALV